MEMEIRDAQRRPLGRATVDLAARPSRVRLQDARRGATHDLFLHWEGAVDDAGQLRTCPACGCQHLFRQRSLPQFTPFVLVLAAAGFILGVMGYSSDPLVLAALIALLALDIAALIVARTLLVCYRCRSRFGRTRVARYVGRWNARTAEMPECQAQAAPSEASAPAPPSPASAPSLPSQP